MAPRDTTIQDAGVRARLEALPETLAERARLMRQPSLSVAFAHAGEVVAAHTTGDANPLGARARKPTANTRYRIASITKPQVAVAVMAAVEAGEVELAAPMHRYLPDAPGGEASISQFLAHTSGLVAEIDGPWWERAGGCTWDELVAMPLRRVSAPGLVHHYSNLGYAILGKLVEVVHDAPWPEVLSRILWEPLGMTQTGVGPGRSHAVGVAVHPVRAQIHAEPVNPYLAMGPAGELWSTPTDLVRFGSFLAGVGQGQGILRPDTLALMRSPAALSAGPGESWRDGYGLGLMLANTSGRTAVFHTGSVPGFTAQLVIEPRTGSAIALCGNATHWCGGALDWSAALTDPLPPAEPELAQPPLPDEAHALTGLWYRGPKSVLVRISDQELVIAPTEMPQAAARVSVDAQGRLVGTSHNYAYGEELLIDPEHSDDPRWFTLARLHFSREPYDPQSDVPGGVDESGWREWRG